jgi:hypothetical protein
MKCVAKWSNSREWTNNFEENFSSISLKTIEPDANAAATPAARSEPTK